MSEDLWETTFALADRIDCRVIFDVGACGGGITLRFMARYPAGMVFSFEPDPEMFAVVSRRFKDPAQGRAFQLALGGTPGPAQFHRGVHRGTSSLFPRNVTGRRYFGSNYTMKETFAVEVETLDRFCAAHAIERIDLLKLDAQGAELAILEGAERLLSNGLVSLIVTEFFFIPHYEGTPLLDSIWSHLRLRGYHIFDIFSGPHGTNGQARFGNAIFVSPQFRQTVLNAMPEEP